MEFGSGIVMVGGNEVILVGAGLVFVSIFAGLVSSRIGAPLLLVFLALGMLAGEDGPGGIDFDDFHLAYAIGATALAIVLFDGGLRTRLSSLRIAAAPALVLATIGVLLTSGLTGAAAHYLLDLNWVQSLLVGAIVGSTDAAAVFFLLHLRGTNLVRRVSATLETESGVNDPMAVFLTVTCVALLQGGLPEPSWNVAGGLALDFVQQIAGGAALGLAGGWLLVSLINAVTLASGLYPVLAVSGALLVFAGSQALGASGFLAVYLAGVVIGNRRHRATQLIARFQDGLAWLSQIVMFLMLGLLVTPSRLVDSLVPALLIAAVLILLARPLAVLVCLLPFRFTWPERAFVGWVGLRGAVPIFLGTVPVLAGLPNAILYFEVAFVVVLVSLVVQGWTVNVAARGFGLALPPTSEVTRRVDVDLPVEVGRDMAAYTVDERSPAATRRVDDLHLGADVDAVAVFRESRMRDPGEAGRLRSGDTVVVVAPAERMDQLDATFGRPGPADPKGRDEAVLGEFAFDASVPAGELARAYDLPIPGMEKGLTLGEFMARHLPGTPDPGDRLRLGAVELIVRAMEDGRIRQVGIELDPQPVLPFGRDTPRIWLRHWAGRLRRRFGRGRRENP